jgi:RimJ/RimL family protein N-acetyltransferase
MLLKAVDTPELLETAAGWLSDPQNSQWLDFGNGVQALTPLSLKLMTQRGLHIIRLYTADDDETPIGVVGLANVDRRFRTASLWAVLGRKRYGGRTRQGCAMMLTLGFREVGLRSVNAWTLETNVAARRCLEKLRFRYVGRLRRCHVVDGRAYDRLLYDLLADEHQGGGVT